MPAAEPVGPDASTVGILDLTPDQRAHLVRERGLGALLTFRDAYLDVQANEAANEAFRDGIRDRVDDPDTAEALCPTTYGLGWRLWDYRGRLLVAHSGAVDGMTSLSGFMPEEDESRFIITLKAPLGSSIEYTESRIRMIESILPEYPEIKASFTTIGEDGTILCDFSLKKSKNCFLISCEVIKMI